jgi:NADH-quinone oxidoreductase subunit N
LAASKRNSNLSIEAGMKYFIFGSFASGLILFGISLIYCFTGSVNYNDIYYLFGCCHLAMDQIWGYV